MIAYCVRRLAWVIPTVLIVATIIFVLMRVIPGDPALLVAGPMAQPQEVERIRHEFRLDEPLYVQYFLWISHLARGDLGISFQTRSPALGLLLERLPRTLELTIGALILTLVMSIPAGVIAARKAHTWIDYTLTALSVFGLSFPMFWLGLMLMLVFSFWLEIMPFSGSGGPIGSFDNLRHLLLPAITLAVPYAAMFTRFTRSAMLEVLSQEYINTARSKGLSEASVVIRHAFRNVLVPVVTLLGLRLPWLFGGAVIVETVFSWPGMGRLVVTAIYTRDFHVVEGFVLILALLVAATNVMVDISYAVINPTIRYA